MPIRYVRLIHEQLTEAILADEGMDANMTHTSLASSTNRTRTLSTCTPAPLLNAPVLAQRVEVGFVPALFLLIFVTMSGCHESGSSGSPRLQSLQITPTSPSAAAGTSVQLTATGIYSDNSHSDLTAQASWATSNTAVATVGASTGHALGVAAGTATLSASLQGLRAATTLTVTAASLVSITITPPIPSIAAGTSEQFTATGTFTDNTTQNLTADLSWASSNTAVATVSSTGLASAVGPGSAMISAACKIASSCGALAGSGTFTVTPATLASIAITPPAPSIALGTSETFTATGTYSDNSTQNLTTHVTWSSATPAVATISNATGTTGLATPIAAGTTLVTAVLGSITSAAARLTVTPATLVSIAITPSAPSIALGTSETFTATGTYSDNSTQNLTTHVTWSSATPAVATISNATGTAGLATPIAAGTTLVTAVLGSVTSTAARLTVTPATLVSIAITPSAPSIALGTSETFTATGTYSDNSTQNLTTHVTWSSATPAVATISSAAGTAGVATSLTTGTTLVTAVLGNVTSPAVTLAVTPATLMSIAITPTGPSIPVAATEQFIATGTYSDNSTQILTATVTWASSATSIAPISNATGSQGLATGLVIGSTSLSAALGGVTLTDRHADRDGSGAVRAVFIHRR